MAQQKDVKNLISRLNDQQPDTTRLTILSHLSSYYNAVDPKMSYKYALDLKKLALKTGHLKKCADADILLGVSWGVRSKYDSAFYYFRQSLFLAEKIKYTTGVADAYINIGQVYYRLNDDVKASANYLKALRLFEKSNYSGGANLCLINLGDIYTGNDLYQIALNYYNRSLINCRLSKNIHGEIAALTSMATCYRKMGKLLNSLNTYEASLKISEENGDFWSQTCILSGEGAVYNLLGRYDEALKYLNKSEGYLSKIGDRDLQSEIYHQLAETYLRQNKLVLSEEYARKSLVIAIEIKSKTKAANAFEILTEINKAKGEFKAAFDFQSKYIRYKDSVVNDDKIKKISLLSLERSQLENLSLTNDNKLQASLLKEKAHQINFYNIVFILGILIIALVIMQTWVLYKSNKQKRIHNELLEKQKSEIAKFNNDLLALNDELSTQMNLTKRQNTELERINKIKTKIYAMISHDFRSPLCTVKNVIQLCETGDISQEEMPAFLHDLSIMVDQTSIFLDNLLIWSKAQMDGINFYPLTFDIKEVISEKLLLFSTQAKMKNITFVNKMTVPLAVFADEAMIRLVLRNLLVNAIKFTTIGGKITISAELGCNEVIIAITDTGKGMNKDVMTGLFDMGHTSLGTSNEKGSGLGLIMCYDFTMYNKGRIWAESEVDIGSTFYLALPISNRY